MKDPERHRYDGKDTDIFKTDDDRYEETYPDGSVKHECWNSGKMKRKKNRDTEDEDEWN